MKGLSPSAVSELRRNIVVYYLCRISLAGLGVVQPRLFSFLESNGYGQLGLSILQMWCTAVCLIAEVPCGLFSDHFGHRCSVRVGLLIAACGTIVYAHATDFAGFILAESLIGIGTAFISGADRAIVYSSLSKYGRIDDGRTVTRRGLMVTFAATLCFSLVGKVVPGASAQTLFIAAAAIYLSGALLSSLAVVHARQRQEVRRQRTSLGALLSLIRTDAEVRWVIAVPAITIGLIRPTLWMSERYVEVLGFERSLNNVLFAMLNGAGFFSLILMSRVPVGNLRTAGMPLVVLTVVTLSLMAGVTHPAAILLPLVLQYVRTTVTAASEHEIQQHVPEDKRATVHSLLSSAQLLTYLAALLPSGMAANPPRPVVGGFLMLSGLALVGALLLCKLRPKG
jgi:MFS family permease